MKTLLFFLMIGFFSWGQVPESVEEPTPPPVAIPVPPPSEVTSPEKTVLEIPSEDIVDFPDMDAEFPCHTFYRYDSLGNVSFQTEVCGTLGLMRFINENVNYPETSIEMNEQGRVFLQFIVEKDGSITNVKVDRGVSIDLDREAKRVIQRMPRWIPGQVNGRNVRSRCRIPINFRLG